MAEHRRKSSKDKIPKRESLNSKKQTGGTGEHRASKSVSSIGCGCDDIPSGNDDPNANQYCELHQCPYYSAQGFKCTTKKRPDVITCNTHRLCNFNGCRSIYESPYQYCRYHRCNQTECDGEVEPDAGREYCDMHECSKRDCHRRKMRFKEPNEQQWRNFCETHSCSEESCRVLRKPNKKHCEQHCCEESNCVDIRHHDNLWPYCMFHHDEITKKKSWNEGKKVGYDEGHKIGFKEGFDDGKETALKRFLESPFWLQREAEQRALLSATEGHNQYPQDDRTKTTWEPRQDARQGSGSRSSGDFRDSGFGTSRNTGSSRSPDNENGRKDRGESPLPQGDQHVYPETKNRGSRKPEGGRRYDADGYDIRSRGD